jgi:hypothetical protein
MAGATKAKTITPHAMLRAAVAETTQVPRLRAVTRGNRTTARRRSAGGPQEGRKPRLLYIGPALYHALRVAAAHQDRSMSDLVEDALRAYLAAHPMDKG